MVNVKYALVADVSLSIHSVKIYESYQVSASYPLVPPSTIVGAVAKSLSALGLCGSGFNNWRDVVNDCLGLARKLILRARDTSSLIGAQGPISIKHPLILHGLRGVLENGKLPSNSADIKSYSDAMVREFILTYPRSILIIPKSEDAINDLIKALWLIDRFGNSESHVSILNVKRLEIGPCDRHDVNVVIKYSPDLIMNGSYTVARASDENGNETMLAMPVSSSQRGDVYYPSSIRIKGDTLCVNNYGKYIIFPAGDYW
ncbi:MAG: type I-A CRISPR-associated protein Cas5a [Vulcanisaeta sp.]